MCVLSRPRLAQGHQEGCVWRRSGSGSGSGKEGGREVGASSARDSQLSGGAATTAVEFGSRQKVCGFEIGRAHV